MKFFVHTLAIAAALAVTGHLSGCAPAPLRLTDPVDIALKTCGLGISTQSSAVFKAAYEIAAKKSSVEFNTTMSQSIDTQEASVLKAIGDKSPEAAKAVLAEIGQMRECVVRQVAALRPASRLDLLEQCRLEIQRKFEPNPNVQAGTLRYWTPVDPEKAAWSEMPVMHGIYEPIGRGFFGPDSTEMKARCDIRDGRLNDVVLMDPSK